MRRLTAIALTLLALGGCKEEAKAPTVTPQPVKVVTIEPSESHDSLTLFGVLKARVESPLAFQVGGKIIERSVELGQQVKRGQVLGRIEPTDLQLASSAQRAVVSQIRSELAQAEADLKRFSQLHAKGFVTDSELARQRTLSETLQAQLRSAEAQQGMQSRQETYTTLTADSDGVITDLSFNVGQVVGAGQVVVTLARPGSREVEVQVPETALMLARAEKSVVIHFDALSGQPIAGRLRELAAAANPSSHTFSARYALDTTPAALALNMTASVQLGKRGASAIRLPLAAVFSRDGHPRVWRVNPTTQQLQAVQVTTQQASGNDWLITSGVNRGDIIVTAGTSLLHEGQKVRPLP